MLVSGEAVEDDMDRPISRDLALDSIEEENEFEMAVALHAAPDDGTVEHAERGEQGSGAVPLVIVRHGLPAPRARPDSSCRRHRGIAQSAAPCREPVLR
jgi:hypothetical protein